MAYYFTFCLFRSQTTFALYSNPFCLTSNYISEPSPKRTPQKPWDSLFKQNPYSGTLTINREFIFEQNSFQKYLQDDCDPFEAPCSPWEQWLHGVCDTGHCSTAQAGNFCLTHELLSSLIRWLLSKETSKPPGRSPSNHRVSFFCHIRWPLAENVRDQRSLQCPGSIYMLEKYLDALVYPSVTAPM